jgi:hypothetical protein
VARRAVDQLGGVRVDVSAPHYARSVTDRASGSGLHSVPVCCGHHKQRGGNYGPRRPPRCVNAESHTLPACRCVLVIRNTLSRVPHYAARVEWALLGADQCMAAMRRGTVWNRVGRAVILVVIFMDVYGMTKGRWYQMGKEACVTALQCAAVHHGIKTVDRAQRAKQNMTSTYEAYGASNVRLLPRARDVRTERGYAMKPRKAGSRISYCQWR